MPADRHFREAGSSQNSYACPDGAMGGEGMQAILLSVVPSRLSFGGNTQPSLAETSLQPGSSAFTASGSSIPASHEQSAEDTDTEKGKGRGTSTTVCKHRKAAKQWRDVAMRKDAQLNTALQIIRSQLETLGSGMTVLHNEFDSTKQGIQRLEATSDRDSRALLGGQARIEQSLQHRSEQYRTQRQSANRGLRDDLRFLAQSIASGETALALQKVQEMLSYMDACANIQGSGHVWGDHSITLSEASQRMTE